MDISVQYLEGGPGTAGISPTEARTRLRAAFERLPLAMVLLGWDLDPRLVDACAQECARHACDLYLWLPLLSAHGSLPTDPDMRVVGLRGAPVAGLDGKPEFTFLCPNQGATRARVLQGLDHALSGGQYQGVFLDRIRFPSPASDMLGQLACFCDACEAVASEGDLDLVAVRDDLTRRLRGREGRHAAISALLAWSCATDADRETRLLRQMLEFRQRSITGFVREIAETSHLKGLKVGLDCFSPTLAPMVGQDIAALAECADWIKVMTYARALAPASIPYEVMGLADMLISAGDETEQEALELLAAATGWPLPRSRLELRQGRLPASILTEELRRGRAATQHRLLAGIELVEMPQVAELSPRQIRIDAQAVRLGRPDGVVLCWDLWHIPADRLDLAGSLYT